MPQSNEEKHGRTTDRLDHAGGMHGVAAWPVLELELFARAHAAHDDIRTHVPYVRLLVLARSRRARVRRPLALLERGPLISPVQP